MSNARTEPYETSTGAPDLATWLLAQIDEDERAARDAGGEWTNGLPATIHPDPTVYLTVRRGTGYVCGSILAEDAAHIARHDPARVLAECDAKRRIVNRWALLQRRIDSEQDFEKAERLALTRHGLDVALHALALPYADRDGYRWEWKP